MRIQHNIAALNSYRQLSGNNSAVAKNLEKLSSGYRINRAGDDAAGLAISEKMRAQITGLETAQKNANDGISLVQTAEGALTEVHSMLNRMVELATQSANGTYDNSVDRANLQKEFDSLLEEVDRISDATNFNGINLLDGSLGGAKVATTTGTKSVNGDAGNTATIATTAPTQAIKTDGATGGDRAKFDFTFMDITAKDGGNDATGVTGGSMKFTIGKTEVDIQVTEGMTGAQVATAIKNKLEENGATFELENTANQKTNFTVVDDGNGKLTFTATAAADFTVPTSVTTAPTNGKVGGKARVNGAASKAELDFGGRAGGDFLGGSVKIGNKTYAFVKEAADAKNGDVAVLINKNSTSKEVADALKQAVTGADNTLDVVADLTGKNAKVTLTEKGTAGTDATAGGNVTNFSGNEIGVEFKGTGLRLQVGDTDDDFQKVRVAVGNMSTKGLDLAALKGAGIADQTTAGTSINKIKAAINTVSSTRGDLGAIQNRLEHTINNLGVTTENMTAAESRIRDTDMAQEMMSYTKNNILVQAAQAMLAQANQVPQGVLQLLQ